MLYLLSIGLLALSIQSADARPRHSHHVGRTAHFHRHAVRHRPRDGNASAANLGRFSSHLVAVGTAAGIPIIVAASVAPAFRGFIADLVGRGYRPRQIHCYARYGHVRHSNHYWGGACDFDQRGWNKTARPMYRVRDLAAKWGLRDGCTFRDCGHIDVYRYARTPPAD